MSLILRPFRILFAALALWLLLPSAQAVIVTGSFQGVAINVTGHDHLPNGGNGSSFTGTFSFDSAATMFDELYITGLHFTMTLDLLGRHLVYGLDGVSIFNNFDDEVGQVVTLNDFTAYWSARMQLAGGPNAFMDGTDFSSFRAAPVDPTRSSIQFSQDRFGSWSTDTVLTQVTIDPIPVTPAIPEPSTWLLLASGLVALGARRSRRVVAPGRVVTPPMSNRSVKA